MGDAPQEGAGKSRCTEADEAGAKAGGALVCCGAQTEYAGDASGKRASVCGEAKRRSGAPLLHGGKRARITEVIAASGDRDIVAAVFTFGAHALVQPPNRRMEKE